MKTLAEKPPVITSVATPPIVCGVDLSSRDDVTFEVAATLAHGLAAPLVLVHAVDLPRAVRRDARAARWITARRKRFVHLAAERLRDEALVVDGRVCVGPPETVLAETAAAAGASMLVLRSLRHRRWERWLGVGVTRLISAVTTTPTLVLRGVEPMRAWLREERPLKVFVCFAGTAGCVRALRWLRGLAAAGPIEVVLGSVGIEHADSGPSGGDVAGRTRELLGEMPVRLRSVPGGGRIDRRLLEMAGEEGADLIVVGAGRRRGWRRLLHRSVSAEMVKRSGTSVVVVPPGGALAD